MVNMRQLNLLLVAQSSSSFSLNVGRVVVDNAYSACWYLDSFRIRSFELLSENFRVVGTARPSWSNRHTHHSPDWFGRQTFPVDVSPSDIAPACFRRPMTFSHAWVNCFHFFIRIVYSVSRCKRRGVLSLRKRAGKRPLGDLSVSPLQPPNILDCYWHSGSE